MFVEFSYSSIKGRSGRSFLDITLQGIFNSGPINSASSPDYSEHKNPSSMTWMGCQTFYCSRGWPKAKCSDRNCVVYVLCSLWTHDAKQGPSLVGPGIKSFRSVPHKHWNLPADELQEGWVLWTFMWVLSKNLFSDLKTGWTFSRNGLFWSMRTTHVCSLMFPSPLVVYYLEQVDSNSQNMESTNEQQGGKGKLENRQGGRSWEPVLSSPVWCLVWKNLNILAVFERFYVDS